MNRRMIRLGQCIVNILPVTRFYRRTHLLQQEQIRSYQRALGRALHALEFLQLRHPHQGR
jgi:hypothetical protein